MRSGRSLHVEKALVKVRDLPKTLPVRNRDHTARAANGPIGRQLSQDAIDVNRRESSGIGQLLLRKWQLKYTRLYVLSLRSNQ